MKNFKFLRKRLECVSKLILMPEFHLKQKQKQTDKNHFLVFKSQIFSYAHVPISAKAIVMKTNLCMFL